MLAGLVLSQCGSNGVGGSGGGAIDDGSGDGSSSTPTPFSADLITAGTAHTCARQAGQAFCWGKGVYGQLGNGAGISIISTSPVVRGVTVGGVTPSTLTGVTAIAAGSRHTCAVAGANDQALCWGKGAEGRLGSGVDANGNLPVLEPSPVEVSTP